ncbi:MAG TPA: hypothetical protein VF488_04215, partial [Gemmatimonadaceae bacterium]
MSDERKDDRELSTADLANAAEHGADRSTGELNQRIEDREVARPASAGPADVAESRSAPLLASDVVNDFHEKWTDIQAGFVDEPRRAV